MSSYAATQISRLVKEIADLKVTDSREAKKEPQIQARINRANEAIQRARNDSTIQSKRREIERASKELAQVQEKRATISTKIADKQKQQVQCELQRSREEERERKKAADEQKRLFRERERHERQITSEMRKRKHLVVDTSTLNPTDSKDFFVCHASEDKESFVRDLAKSLEEGGASVWFDEFTLKVGDSLRREIDKGLANSKFGVVVLSTHFFEKEWPQRELDGLVSLDMHGSTRILPIWHQVTKDIVLRHSPMLADRVALNTSISTVDEIVSELLEFIKAP